MAKSDLGKYMTPSARSFLRAQQPRVNVPQRRATIDPTLFKSKPAAGAPLESRLIEAPIQETGPEAMSITDGEASTQPQMVTETQQPIESRGSSARYMIQGGGPRIDLSFLVPERVNPAYDPSKAIGGENVPYQESKGVGGFFRRLLGDESNRMNIEAQQAQGAEWREAEKEAQKEERLLNRIREADKPTQARFDAAQEAARLERIAERESRKGEREQEQGIRKGERAEDRADRLAREAAEMQLRRQEMLDRVTQQQLQADTQREDLALRTSVSNQPSMSGLSGGGLAVMDPRSGSISIVNPGTVGFGEKFPGTAPTTRQVYPQPKAPVNTGGGQVDRTDGSTLGGRLPAEAGVTSAPRVTPTRSGLMDMIGAGAENVAGALGLEGMAQVPAALGDLLTRDPKELEKTARSRARYMNPSMQRTY